VLADAMLRSHSALRLLTGSCEMSVFHTLFAGNIGQRRAPGTVVPAAGAASVAGAAGRTWATGATTVLHAARKTTGTARIARRAMR
jgi:hypothetical protein